MIDEIKKLIVEQLNVPEEKVTPEARLIEDLGVDSLDTLEMLMNLEDEYGIQIPNEDAQKLITVQDVANYIESKKTK
jgi:acyl carrier protein